MSPDNSRRTIRAILRTSLFVTCGLLLAAGLLLLVIPTLDGPHSRQLANEASAVSKLRTVLTLQDQYMAAHAGNGFACELPLLKPPEQRKDTDYDPLSFLITGTQSGYRFSLVNCGSDANRARVHYQLIAVPVEHGTTGFRAFCADESGSVWYDKAGSATNCLDSRLPLQ
jgi:hypothetical protein